MKRVGGWLPSRISKTSSSSSSLESLDESQELYEAMQAVSLIMNDDVDGAEAGLSKSTSSFHKLGRGLVTFLRATLGFEQDIMKEASERLAGAESSASSDYSRALKHEFGYQSAIYTTGSEYALCTVEAQIMAAVVGVLNESLTESLRGFYKIRKAYITLDGLLAMEQRYARDYSARQSTRQSTESSRSTPSNMSTNTSADKDLSGNPPRTPSSLRQSETVTPDDDSEDGEFADADEEKLGAPTPTNYVGRISFDDTEKKLEGLSISGVDDGTTSIGEPFTDPLPPSQSANQLLNYNADHPAFTNPLDGFIHSGVNVCFGLLLLLISAIPPSFSKLLYIVGFRGDREKGILLLWQASKFNNIHGAMAALCLLGWYNALVGSCDMVPDPTEDSTPETQIEGYPVLRLQNLVAVASERYPKSALWALERARMASGQRQLASALKMLDQPCNSPLKQVAALHMFEKSLNAMYAHEHQLCAKSFITCVDLNSWSKALYYYNAGASHLAMYRDLRQTSPEQASEHARAAENYFRTAPTHVGKKKIMAKQLPFDTFVSRKIQKWEARAKEWNVPFVDAVGVAPTEEMTYLWAGHRKMNTTQLEKSLEILSWSDDPQRNPIWMYEGLDEKAILAVLRATVLRNLRRHDEAKTILQKEVLDHPRASFKGPLKDEWTAPIANLEMGVNIWMQRTQYKKEHGTTLVDEVDITTTTAASDGPPPYSASTAATTTPKEKGKGNMGVEVDVEQDRNLVRQSKHYIETVKTWDSRYELDSRLGLKVTSAWDAIGKWEGRYGPC